MAPTVYDILEKKFRAGEIDEDTYRNSVKQAQDEDVGAEAATPAATPTPPQPQAQSVPLWKELPYGFVRGMAGANDSIRALSQAVAEKMASVPIMPEAGKQTWQAEAERIKAARANAAAQLPAWQTEESVKQHGFSDLVTNPRYVAGAIGEMLPYAPTTLVGASEIKAGMSIPQKLTTMWKATMPTMFPVELGATLSEQEQRGEQMSIPKALPGATVAAAIEGAPEAIFPGFASGVRKLMGVGGEEAVKRGLTKYIFDVASSGAGKDAVKAAGLSMVKGLRDLGLQAAGNYLEEYTQTIAEKNFDVSQPALAEAHQAGLMGAAGGTGAAAAPTAVDAASTARAAREEGLVGRLSLIQTAETLGIKNPSRLDNATLSQKIYDIVSSTGTPTQSQQPATGQQAAPPAPTIPQQEAPATGQQEGENKNIAYRRELQRRAQALGLEKVDTSNARLVEYIAEKELELEQGGGGATNAEVQGQGQEQEVRAQQAPAEATAIPPAGGAVTETPPQSQTQERMSTLPLTTPLAPEEVGQQRQSMEAMRERGDFIVDESTRPTPEPPVVTQEQVSRALPAGTVTQNMEGGGWFVSLPNDRQVWVMPTGEIKMNKALAASRGQDTGGRVAASWKPIGRDAIIRIVDGGELDHEVFHDAVEFALSPSELLQLRKDFNDDWEAAARGYNEWVAGRRESAQSGVWGKVREFFTRIKDALYTTSEGAMRAVESGRAYRREGIGGERAVRESGMAMPDRLPGESAEAYMVRAWHGGPHKIEGRKGWKLDRAGTGEGAAAYGWGAYFASLKDVAEEYKKNLSGRVSYPELKRAIDTMESPAAQEILRNVAIGATPPSYITSTPGIAEMLQLSVTDKKLFFDAVKSPGYLYRAELDVNDEDLLDWDKPLSEQSEKVKKALRGKLIQYDPKKATVKVEYNPNWNYRERVGGTPTDKEQQMKYGADLYYKGERIISGYGPTEEAARQNVLDALNKWNDTSLWTGKDVYEFFVHKAGGSQNYTAPGSKYLRDKLGIPGIRYLDGGSRRKGDGTHNYVIFDENLISLTHRNDEEMYSVKEGAPNAGEAGRQLVRGESRGQEPGRAVQEQAGGTEAAGASGDVQAYGRGEGGEVGEERYSAKSPNNLVTVHNLTAANLKHAADLGGLAVPSIAISRVESPVQGFGEITLVGDKRMVTPSRENPVFEADAYTGRHPRPKYKIDYKKMNALAKELEDKYGDALGGEKKYEQLMRDLSGREIERGQDELESAARSSLILKAAYISEVMGEDPTVPKEIINRAAKNHADFEINSFLRGKLDDEDAYTEWSIRKLDGIIHSPYLQSGYVKKPYNLDNIVSRMKAELRGAERASGLGALRSLGAKRFKTIEQIQKVRDNIVAPEQFEEMRKSLDEEFFSLSESLAPYYKSEGNQFYRLDGVADAISEAFRRGGSISKALVEYGYQGVPSEIVSKMYDFSRKLKNAPAKYFEAKPQRAVKIGEFKTAVIPSDADAATREILERNGLQIFEYERGNEDSRRSAIKDASEGERYSVTPPSPQKNPLDKTMRSPRALITDAKAQPLRQGPTPTGESLGQKYVKPDATDVGNDNQTRIALTPRSRADYEQAIRDLDPGASNDTVVKAYAKLFDTVSHKQTARRAQDLLNSSEFQQSVNEGRLQGTILNSKQITALRHMAAIAYVNAQDLRKVYESTSDTKDRVAWEEAAQTFARLKAIELGNKAELGRTMNALRLIARAQGDLLIAKNSTAKDKVWENLVKGLGRNLTNRESLQVEALDEKDYAKGYLLLSRLLNKRRSTGDYVHAYQYMNLLVNVMSATRNISGNLFQNALEQPTELLATLIDEGMGKLGKKQGKYMKDYLAAWAATDLAFENTLRETGNLMRYGFTDREAQTGIDEDKFGPGVDFKGGAANPLNWAKRLQGLGDVPFTSWRYVSASWQIATRQAIQEMEQGLTSQSTFNERVREIVESGEVHEEADAIARRTTGTQQLGPLAGAVNKAISWSPEALDGIRPLRFLFPFYRIAMNLQKIGYEYTPIGGARLAMPSTWKTPGKAADVIAKQMVGVALMWYVAQAAASGDMTGPPPEDKEEKDRWEAEGIKPYQFRVPGTDKWITWNNLGAASIPFALGFGAAELKKKYESGEIPEDKLEALEKSATIVTLGLAKSFVDSSLMTAVARISDALSRGGKTAEKLVASIASQAVPFAATARQAEVFSDEYLRDPQGIIDRIKAGIPIYAKSVDTKMLMGEPVRNPRQWSLEAIFPYSTQRPSTDEIAREYADDMMYKEDSAKKMTSEQKRRYDIAMGRAQREATSYFYQNNSEMPKGPERTALLKKYVDKYKYRARKQFYQEEGIGE